MSKTDPFSQWRIWSEGRLKKIEVAFGSWVVIVTFDDLVKPNHKDLS
jgi:hypothetical protein